MSHRFDLLKSEIFKRSIEKNNWEQALMEWEWIGLVTLDNDTPDRCLCSQPIENKYKLRHRETQEEIVVGCVCICRFMRENVELVDKTERAEYERVRRPCNRCAEWTVHPEYCKRCERDMEKLNKGWSKCKADPCLKLLEEPGYCKQCKPAMLSAKYNKVVSLINMNKLNETERNFVTVSVQKYVLTERPLSNKQRGWLKSIILKHPAR